MRDLWIAAAAFLAGLAVVVVMLRRAGARAAARARLGESAPEPTSRAEPPSIPRDTRRFVSRNRWLPWLVAIVVFVGLYFGIQAKLPYAILPALAIGLLGSELDRARVSMRESKIDAQLADAIDLMVGVLRAGGGASAALEGAVRETRWPLKPQLAEIVGRIRLGDDPQATIRDLTSRVPLENFVLFASALSVHWEVGGSLAATLATVGKSIRDRIELSRRVRSQTTQAKASVLAVLAATYFIAVVIWRNNPDRMTGFLSTEIGAWLIGVAVLFQVIGVVWSLAATRIKY